MANYSSTKQERISNEKKTHWMLGVRKTGYVRKTYGVRKMVLGKLDSNIQKSETGPLSYTIHKNNFKMANRPKCET